MENAIEGEPSSQAGGTTHRRVGWQVLWFLLHLAAVYLIVNFATPYLAGWTRGTLLPLLHQPTTASTFQFFFSHLFAFSFVPAFLTGLANARFKHRVAEYVWLVPVAALTYKFATFSAPSVFQSRFDAAFHQYFAGGFLISEYHDWNEFWSIVGSNSDTWRGMAQLRYTAPVYAAIGYSIAAWIGRRTDLNRKVGESVRQLEQSKFGPNS